MQNTLTLDVVTSVVRNATESYKGDPLHRVEGFRCGRRAYVWATDEDLAVWGL